MGKINKNLISSLVISGMMVILTCSCKKKEDKPIENDPFKVISLSSVTDNIPYQALGSGKIVFFRMDEPEGTGVYVIDIDRKTATGFRLNSPILEPNISPEGTKIACSLLNSSDWRSMWNIFVMKIDGSECLPVFKSYSWQSYPTWTPDGSKILFYNLDNEGPLYKQSPGENSADRVELTKFYYGDDPDWIIIPSGGFSCSPENNLVCASKGGYKAAGILAIIPYTGKPGVNILLPFTENHMLESPVFSPDGHKIAFASIETDTLGNMKDVSVNIINHDGTNLAQLVSVKVYNEDLHWSGHNRLVSLCWSPDGSKILFTALTEANGGYHLFVINADGSGLTQVTDNINAYDYDVSWGR